MPHDDETLLRALIAEQFAAICARDVDRIVAPYAEDLVLYDAIPPFQTRGPAALRQTWAECLPYFPESFEVEQRELVLQVSGDLAFSHSLFRFTGPTEHPATQQFLRLTGCYRKRDGRWQVVHEHISVPFDPMTSQAVLTLEPDTKS